MVASSFMEGRYHTSLSAYHCLKFSTLSRIFAKCKRHTFPDDFMPYRALHIMAVWPLAVGPNNMSSVIVTWHFSSGFAFKYALPMSADNISSPFKAANVKHMRTDSGETTLEYVVCCGTSLLRCSPATSRAFLVRSIFTSNMKW